jgi:hypothetical protein
MAHAGHRFGHIKAIGLREVQVRTKAQFEHQQGMIEQVGTPTRRREQLFADPDQRGFEIGARRMGWPSWPAFLRWINGAPVKERASRTCCKVDWSNRRELGMIGLMRVAPVKVG